ncbi:MAG: hypothetical protein Q9201_003450 [Fulgogasparrea decipioides]
MSTRTTSLSPPPLKRRRISPPKASSPTSPRPSTIPKISQPETTTHSRSTSLRIYSWNINGIAPYLNQQRSITSFFPTTSATPKSTTRPSSLSLRACFRRWAFPHIVCLQEVKIAPQDTSSQTSVRRVVNDPLSDDDDTTAVHRLYDAHFNLPRDKHNATGFGGKVYGVCMLVRRDIATALKVRIPDWDLEGRVQILELPKHALVVLGVYAVNGTTNPYRDPATGKVVGDRHMRKRRFHEELRHECARYEDHGWNVIIAGDINISQTPLDSYPQLRMGRDHVLNRTHFRDCFIKGKEEGGLGMRDSFREIRGEERKFSYRPRERAWGEGMDRVDLVLVSQGVKLKDADILDTEDERGTSDHVPLCVEIETASAGIAEE